MCPPPPPGAHRDDNILALELDIPDRSTFTSMDAVDAAPDQVRVLGIQEGLR